MSKKWFKGILALLMAIICFGCPLEEAEYEVIKWEAVPATVIQGEEIHFKATLLVKNRQQLESTVVVEKLGLTPQTINEEQFKITSDIQEVKELDISWTVPEDYAPGSYDATLSLKQRREKFRKFTTVSFNVTEVGAPLVEVKMERENLSASEVVDVDISNSRAAIKGSDTIKNISYLVYKIINKNEIAIPTEFKGTSTTEAKPFSFIAPSEEGSYKLRVVIENASGKIGFGEAYFVVVASSENGINPDMVDFGAGFGPKNYRFYHARYNEMNGTTNNDNKHEVALKTKGARTLNLHGWKNDIVNAQLVTWTAPSTSATISVKKGNLTGLAGTIPASNIKISRLKYIYTNNTVAHYGSGAVGDYTESNINYNAGVNGLNYYADCLYATTDEEITFKVEKKRFQPYWVQIEVPKDAAAGNYSGELVVSFDGLDIKLALNLEVLNITVPDYKDREFILHTWMHSQAIVHSYCGCFPDDVYDIALSGTYNGEHRCGVTKDGIMTYEGGVLKNKTKLWSDEHFRWYLPVLQELYKSGQRNLFVNLVKDPWPNGWGGHGRGAIQQTYYSYDDMVIWKCNGNTSVKANWSVDLTYLKKYLDWAMNTSLDNGEKMVWEWIDCVGPLVWATSGNDMRIFYYDTADNYKYKIYSGGINDNWQAIWEVFFTEFKSYIVEKGWFEKVRISVDERGIENIAELNNRILSKAAFMHNGKMIKSSAAGNSNHNIHGVSNSNRIQFFSFDGGATGPTLRFGSDAEAKTVAQARRAYTGEYSKGNDTTFSTTVTTYPSHANNGLPAESQFMGWYAARIGFSGHLKWSFDSWSGPMVNPKNAEAIRTFPLLSADNKIFPAGDASHIYPGDPNAAKAFIRSSVRQELSKEGYLYYDKIRHLVKRYAAAQSDVDSLLNSQAATRPVASDTCGATGSIDYRGRRYLYDFSDKVDELETSFYNIVKKYVH